MRLLSLFALVFACGCVSSGKYQALQKELDRSLRSMQAQLDVQAEELRQLRVALERERAEKDQRIAVLEHSLKSANRKLEADQGKLANMLKDRSRLKASVADMKRALAELEERRRAAEARVAEFRKLVEMFKPLIDTGRLRVKIVDGRMVVELATDVLFASGSAKLSIDGKEAIVEVSKVLASVLGRKFQIEGHTDDVPIRTKLYKSNWELAAARSITVVKAMVGAGMPEDRVSAASFGEFKPVSSNASSEGKASNRRIEIVLVPDLTRLPGFAELNELGG